MISSRNLWGPGRICALLQEIGDHRAKVCVIGDIGSQGSERVCTWSINQPCLSISNRWFNHGLLVYWWINIVCLLSFPFWGLGKDPILTDWNRWIWEWTRAIWGCHSRGQTLTTGWPSFMPSQRSLCLPSYWCLSRWKLLWLCVRRSDCVCLFACRSWVGWWVGGLVAG